jgi:hypothetical protein
MRRRSRELFIGRIPTALALGVLALATELGASGGAVVTQVVRDGVDITRDVPDATLVFLPNPPQEGFSSFSKENALRCALREPCRVPPGSYRVELEHPQVVAAIRPMLRSPVETEVASIPVHVIASYRSSFQRARFPRVRRCRPRTRSRRSLLARVTLTARG